jgi:hypothetical protein
LTLVDRFVQLGIGTHAEGVHQLTNFQRRLGLGTPTDPPSRGLWIDLLKMINKASDHNARVNMVMSALSSLPPAVPEHISRGWPTVGAFSIEISGTIARTHFYSTDLDDTSPLHPTKLDVRRYELQTVLSIVRKAHPELDHVAGGSWLYTTSSYASLFPPEHTSTAVARRGVRTFRACRTGASSSTTDGKSAPICPTSFSVGSRPGTVDDPCALFPVSTLLVSSPLKVFNTPG